MMKNDFDRTRTLRDIPQDLNCLEGLYRDFAEQLTDKELSVASECIWKLYQLTFPK